MSSLHRELMGVLLGDIAAGTLSEGERLPSIVELAGQFSVSTGVVRECQRALAERGVVSVHHGRRALVRPEADWDVFDPDVLTALVAAGRAIHLLGEYLESRRILEVEAAGLAAERADLATVERLSSSFHAMRRAAERARLSVAAEPLYHQADVEFHKAIIRAAGNRPLARMAEPIHAALSATFAELARPQLRFERGLPEHERILVAIEARDAAGARLAMREHLLTVEGYLRERRPDSPAAVAPARE